MWNSLNRQSQQMIQNIANGFKSHPMYQGYDISTFAYDMQTGGVMMDVEKNGVVKKKFLFMPNERGDIYNIAIYGQSLDSECQAIRNSGLCFGLPVEEVSIDNEGMSRFVDVYIGDYSHLV